MGWFGKLFGSAKSPGDKSSGLAKYSAPAVGKCSKCGRAVYSPSMAETEELMMSGRTDMIQAMATSCPKCNALCCAGCAHRSNTKCPKCGVAVVEQRYRE